MEQAITQLVGRYEKGRIGRRELIQSLAILVSAAGTASAAGFKTKGIDHVSLTVTDPARSAEFYKRVFELVEVREDLRGPGEVRLAQTVDDRPLVVFRTGTPVGVIDHFALGVEPYDPKAAAAALKDKGVVPDAKNQLRDPDGIRFHLMKSDPR